MPMRKIEKWVKRVLFGSLLGGATLYGGISCFGLTGLNELGL